MNVFILPISFQVASIVGRAEPMAAICFLFVVSMYVDGNLTKSATSNRRLLITIGAAVVGMLCKEQAIMCLPVCTCCLLLHSIRAKTKDVRTTLTRKAAVLVIAFLTVIQVRFVINGKTQTPIFSNRDNPIESWKGEQRLLIVLRLAFEAFKLILMPNVLTCDRSYGHLDLTFQRNNWFTRALLIVSTVTFITFIANRSAIAKRLKHPNPNLITVCFI
jgi:hypothetical protein